MNPFNVKLYKSVEVAPEEDEAVKKTDTVDSVQLSDLTENLRYVLQLGLNVDTKVDQNEYSEVDQSIRQFLGTPDPNIIKDMNNDHLFRRVFSNLVTGRFPSSFREFAGPISRLEAAHIKTKFKHFNYDVGLYSWSNAHVIETMFKLAKHSGDVTVRKVCLNINPKRFAIGGFMLIESTKKFEAIIRPDVIGRNFGAYGLVPDNKGRKLILLATFFEESLKQGYSTMLVAFDHHARTLFKSESFGWLFLNSHGTEKKFYTEISSDSGYYNDFVTHKYTVTYSKRFASALSLALLSISEEEAQSASVSREKETVEESLEKLPGLEWNDSVKIAFCNMQDIINMWCREKEKDETTANFFEDICKLMKRQINDALSLLVTWDDKNLFNDDSVNLSEFDDLFNFEDKSDGSESEMSEDADDKVLWGDEEKVEKLCKIAASNIFLLAKAIVLVGQPYLYLPDFWIAVWELSDLFLRVMKHLDLAQLIHSNSDYKVLASETPEKMTLHYLINKEQPPALQPMKKSAELIDYYHEELLEIINVTKLYALESNRPIFEYGLSYLEKIVIMDQINVMHAFEPYAGAETLWWANHFESLQLIKLQEIQQLQGVNRQCTLYSVFMAIYFECIKNNQKTIRYRKLFEADWTLKDAFSNPANPAAMALVDRLYNLAAQMHRQEPLINEWVRFHSESKCKLCGCDVLNGEHTDIHDFFVCLFKRCGKLEKDCNPQRLIELLNNVFDNKVEFREKQYNLVNENKRYLHSKKIVWDKYYKGEPALRHVLSEVDILKMFLWDVKWDVKKCSFNYFAVMHMYFLECSWGLDKTFFDILIDYIVKFSGHNPKAASTQKQTLINQANFFSACQIIDGAYSDALRRFSAAKQGLDILKDKRIQLRLKHISEGARFPMTELLHPQNRQRFLTYLLLSTTIHHHPGKTSEDTPLIKAFVDCLSKESITARKLIEEDQKRALEGGSTAITIKTFDDEEGMARTQKRVRQDEDD